MQVPDDLRYAENHEWARLEADGSVRVGIKRALHTTVALMRGSGWPQVGRGGLILTGQRERAGGGDLGSVLFGVAWGLAVNVH